MNIKLPKIETYLVNVDGQIMALAKCQFDALRVERAKGNINFLAVQDAAGDWHIVDALGKCPKHPFDSSEKSICQLFKIQRERKK